MFGLIVSGRLVQTNAVRVDESHVVFQIEDGENVNHVVVFLTGDQAFPDGFAGAVYFNWPTPNGQDGSWIFLGYVSNAKPSAIFKITNLKHQQSQQSSLNGGGILINETLNGLTCHATNAQIGISIEPESNVKSLTPALGTQPSQVSNFSEFSRKMMENFVNYANSFAVSQDQMTPMPSETFVPASALQKWFQNFQRRLSIDPYFWKK